VSRQRSASVSLCMIVRDEAHQLADCLTPLADLFDDIVIVDTGSRDETRQIARRFTHRVVDFAWCDDFSAARNESLHRAAGEWIFWLDADDRLTPENVARLRTILNALSSRPSAFLMDTLCVASSAGEMERVVTQPRLFRRHPALKWRRRIHEQLDPWPAALGFEMSFSDVRIDHLGYLDAAVVERKLQRNIRLLRMEYAINPDDPDALIDLGVAHARRGNSSEAHRHFGRLLEIVPRCCLHTRRMFTALVELAIQEGKFQEAVDASARGLVFFPDDAYLAFMQAEALYQLGEYDAAQPVLVRIIREPEPPRGLRVGVPNDIRRRLAPLGLSEVLRMRRALDQAEWVLGSVTQAFPHDPVVWHQLGRIYVDLGDRQKLERVLDRLSACSRGKLFSSLLNAAWQLSRGELAVAEKAIDESIAQAPAMPLPRAMRAVCLSRRGAPQTKQRGACRDMLRVQPGNAHILNLLAGLESTRHEAGAAPQHDWYGSVTIGSHRASGASNV
jgi:glycosyltransferase involved in cell wall biosynthesis